MNTRIAIRHLFILGLAIGQLVSSNAQTKKIRSTGAPASSSSETSSRTFVTPSRPESRPSNLSDSALLDHLSAENHVTNRTPPTLLVHAADDGPVPIENSRLMLAALQQAGVLSMMHEYPTGGHGFGYYLEQEKNKVEGWLDRAHEWLKKHGLVS